MNTYEKLTVASFTSKLQSGDYASLAGARRAIGKAQDMSTNDKNKAREAADKYFMGGAAPKTKAPAPVKKAPVKKVAAVAKPAKAAPVKKAARAKKPEAAQARAPRGRPKGRPTTHAAAAQEAAATVPEKVAQAQSHLSLANQAIQTVSSALTAIKECKTIYPNLDMNSGQRAADALLKTIEFVTNSVAPVFPKVPEVPVSDSPNGVMHEQAPALAATP